MTSLGAALSRYSTGAHQPWVVQCNDNAPSHKDTGQLVLLVLVELLVLVVLVELLVLVVLLVLPSGLTGTSTGKTTHPEFLALLR